VLSPISRWPTRLPEATVKTVLARSVPKTPANRGGRTPAVSIIVPTFNSLVFTRLCLETLLANTGPPCHEVVVVDNGSSDGTAEYLRALERRNSQVRAVFNDRNHGFARAGNQGLALARGRVLVLLNNDTLVPAGWLTGLLRHLDDARIGLVGPVSNRAGNEAQVPVPYGTFGGFERFAHDYSTTHAGDSFDIPMLAMFCVALPRAAWERVGPLDEGFGIGLFEDDDYALRVHTAGYRVVCAEDVFVHHFGQASLGHLAATGDYGKLFHHNRRLFEAKWDRAWRPHLLRPHPSYHGLAERIRTVVQAAVPAGATVLVVSKGDDQLLDFGDRTGWHFPRAEDGGYAGHYPPDSEAAIEHLEALRAEGGRFLVVPQCACWWLEHYDEFRRHLESHCTIVCEDESCLISVCQMETGRYEVVRQPGGRGSDTAGHRPLCRAGGPHPGKSECGGASGRARAGGEQGGRGAGAAELPGLALSARSARRLCGPLSGRRRRRAGPPGSAAGRGGRLFAFAQHRVLVAGPLPGAARPPACALPHAAGGERPMSNVAFTRTIVRRVAGG
jgi:GT2 family glycosyltransferase